MEVLLGINIGHDAGATLLIDGTVIFAGNEERFSRIKNHVGFPFLSIAEAISAAGGLKISTVAIEGKAILPLKTLTEKPQRYISALEIIEYINVAKLLIGTSAGVRLIQRSYHLFQHRRRAELKATLLDVFEIDAPIYFVDHHTAHIASSTLATKDLKNGLALSFDASGEGWCSKVAAVESGSLRFLPEFDVPSYFSPAKLYANITSLLGFRPLRHEGKVTGLAAFGSSNPVAQIIGKQFGFSEKDEMFYNNLGYETSHLKLRRLLIDYKKEDIAAGAQRVVEDTVVGYLRVILKKTNMSKQKLYVSGGLFANVKLNQRIIENTDIKELFVTPNMGDGGLSLGAALLTSRSKITPLENMYLGVNIPDLPSFEVPSHMVCELLNEDDISRRIANLLAANKIVAISRGNAEFGPRALCNRSILYSAKDATVNTWLNKRLRRTEFMPFAPVVRDTDALKYFKLNPSNMLYDFMTCTVECNQITKTECPAIVHVDGTARPQVVQQKTNPLMYDILTKYSGLAGHGVLVNTSFNMHEEPIVNTVHESIKAFDQSKIDFLLVGNFLLSQKATAPIL